MVGGEKSSVLEKAGLLFVPRLGNRIVCRGSFPVGSLLHEPFIILFPPQTVYHCYDYQ